MDKIQVQSYGSYLEPGGARNEKFGVGIPENFDVQSARRALKENLEFVRNTRVVISLRNVHRERNHNIHGVGAIGSIREKGNPSRP
jgi:hypothetical protein